MWGKEDLDTNLARCQPGHAILVAKMAFIKGDVKSESVSIPREEARKPATEAREVIRAGVSVERHHQLAENLAETPAEENSDQKLYDKYVINWNSIWEQLKLKLKYQF